MLPKKNQNSLHYWRLIHRVVQKEVGLFFTSPIAYLFLVTFALISLFIFFWGEAFFSRNIADIRPLFEWMPILLIFLSSTLTMRLWSEERRTGTLEHVLTQPTPIWCFVLGKFFACLILLVIAILITLPLPITVSMFGDIDWGPVLAAYLATLLLGSAYLSIGLLVSSRSDNQIVSLIFSVGICGLFYLFGSDIITNLFGNQASEWLRSLGTGSRFESIARGIIDAGDLYYYLSIVIVCLSLNVLVLERERWSTNTSEHHKKWRFITLLVIVNAVAANFWLSSVNQLRSDVTEGQQYSISPATEQYLAQLREPLLIRGYFSNKTHPLLAPLVPQLRDLIKEYEIAGKGNVRGEFIDPINNPDYEEEANQKYAIKPVPFQIADRYESSIVSSYFNVLVSYGDEYQVLGFRDLIDIKSSSESNIDVQLRNPEHDLTRAIKKVLASYQSAGNLFDTVKGDLQFTAYVSAINSLPKKIGAFKKTVEESLEDFKNTSDGRLQVNFIDPDANGGQIAQEIARDFGFRPMATNLFSQDQFYFYMTLSNGEQIVQIPLDDLSQESFKRNLESGIKRFASGFTKTVALVTPTVDPQTAQFGQPAKSFQQMEQFLGAELNVQSEDISDGNISAEADVAVLLAPKELDKKALFAVDQFLMQGGSVIIASSPFSANISSTRIDMQSHKSGLEDWLKHHGLNIDNQLVLDKQNAAFPAPVTRNVGGFSVQEMRMLDYPYFPDVRGKALNPDNAITAGLPRLVTAWASPITVDEDKNKVRKVTELLRSSEQAWLSDSMDVMPRFNANSNNAFPSGEAQQSHLLGVLSAGRFDSYFSGKQSPLLDKETASDDAINETDSSSTESGGDSETAFSSVIEHSPESAQIILFSSNDFLSDAVVGLTGAATGSRDLSSVQMLANSVDWALEDQGLLSIRARGKFNRTLPPMERRSQHFWEYLNYLLAIAAIALVGFIQRLRRKARHKHYRAMLTA